MLHEPKLSILATALHNQPRSPKRDALIYWTARQRFNELLDAGRLILAAVMLDEIRAAGEALLSGPQSGHALGRRMAQMGADPFRGRGFLSHMRGAR